MQTSSLPLFTRSESDRQLHENRDVAHFVRRSSSGAENSAGHAAVSPHVFVG